MSSRAQPRVEGAPAPGLPERYRIRRHLATGGMASVWSAEDLVLGRAVAIKVLARGVAHDEMAVRRFKREARAAARVSNHAHVVTIFDVGDTVSDRGDESDPDNVRQAFIVMEHLTGGTVADAMRVESINRHEALRWLREAASALDHAHSRGIVHRDIKPANFLLDSSRILHVADFGIARLVSEDTITSSGELFGTAAYLSPEQALGRDATGASDRYALTVAAFELLAGERPFTARHFAAQARQHIEDPPPSASERNRALPPDVDPVLSRGMAKEPEARYETAGAIVAALEEALSASPLHMTRAFRGPTGARVGGGGANGARNGAHPPGTAGSAVVPVARSGRRRGRAFALTALVAAVIAVGTVALTGLGGSGHPASAAHHGGPASASVRSHRSQAATRPAPAGSARSATTAQSSAAASRPTTTAASSRVASSADQLEATGHQLLLDGNYQAAESTLRQAISAAPRSSSTYAYALYDLGRSLTLSGDPSSAIPVLQRRLKIPNQTPVVRQALDQALRAAGQVPAGFSQTTSPQPPSGKPSPSQPPPTQTPSAKPPSTRTPSSRPPSGKPPSGNPTGSSTSPGSGGAGIGPPAQGPGPGHGHGHGRGGGGQTKGKATAERGFDREARPDRV